MYQALSRMTRAQSISLGLTEKLGLLQALGGPKLLLHRMPPRPRKSPRPAAGRPAGGTPRPATPRRSPITAPIRSGYARMLIARAITSAAMPRDTAASVVISSLAHGLIAEMSVGLNAVAVQKPSDK